MGCSLRSDFSPHVCAPYLKVSPHSLIHSKIKDRGSVNTGINTRFSVPPPLVIFVSRAIKKNVVISSRGLRGAGSLSL